MYCRYCGKEVLDTAFVCPACGSIVGKLPPEYQKQAEENLKKQQEVDVFFGSQQSQQPKQTKTVQPPLSRKEKIFSALAKIFSIVGIVFSGIALFCMLFALVDALSYGEGWYALGWIYAEICGAIGCELGIAGFVFGRLQKHSQGLKKLSLWAFILGIASCVIATSFIMSPWLYV